jgi:hypothetical protein
MDGTCTTLFPAVLLYGPGDGVKCIPFAIRQPEQCGVQLKATVAEYSHLHKRFLARTQPSDFLAFIRDVQWHLPPAFPMTTTTNNNNSMVSRESRATAELALLAELVQAVEAFCEKKKRNPLTLPARELSFSNLKLQKNSALRQLTSPLALQARLFVVQKLNALMATSLPLLERTQWRRPGTTAAALLHQRGLLFGAVKDQVWRTAMASYTSTAQPEITVNRHRAAYQAGRSQGGTGPGQATPTAILRGSLFGQICAQLNHLPPERLRNTDRVFRVNFEGEGSIDAGGPYRESLTQMCQELHSSHMPLLVPCANRLAGSGSNRDKFVPNPALTEPYHMSCFTFFGKLVGLALRTDASIPLHLPPIVWKQLVSQTISLQDLAAIDLSFVQYLHQLRQIGAAHRASDPEAGGMQEVFDEELDHSFTTQSSDGREVELTRNGASLPVTFENHELYCDLAQDYRMNECSEQCRRMRRGMGCIVPIKMVQLLSWQQLEVRVCGKPQIDLALLRSKTTYSGFSESDAPVKFFWDTLSSFTSELRSAFLQFAWGRSRLPHTADQFTQSFTINKLNSSDPDASFPLAHTCFFEIDLPAYSTRETTRSRLIYAITECTNIDMDGGGGSFSVADWDDDDQEGED